LLALLATNVSSQLKHVVFRGVVLLRGVTRVSIGYSPKSQAKQTTQACLETSPKASIRMLRHLQNW